MLTFKGYIPMRRGLLQHLTERRMTPTEFAVFSMLLLWADHRTGIARTNAPGLVYLSGDQLDLLKYTRKCLASLEEKGYIKTPFYVQGQRGDQKIVIDKFVVTQETEKGTEIKTLSFADTTDWNSPAYVNLSEEGSGKGSGEGSGNAPSNEKLKTEELETGEKVSGSGSRGQVKKDQRPNLGETPNPQNSQIIPAELQPSGNNTKDKTNVNPNNLSGSEFQRAMGAVEHSSPVNSKTPSPSSAAPRTDKQVLCDSMVMVEELRKTMRTIDVELRQKLGLLKPDWTELGRMDLDRLMRSTPDSVDTICAAAKWGIETSDYWFKLTTKGILRSFTDFVNAYVAISKAYHKYQGTRKGATV